jgi:hypothetical protein
MNNVASSAVKNGIIRKFCKLDERGRALLTPFAVSKEKRV